MATIHVIYDPRDRIQVGGDDRMPREIKFAAMKCDSLDDAESISAIAGELAEMLLEQIAKN